MLNLQAEILDQHLPILEKRAAGKLWAFTALSTGIGQAIANEPGYYPVADLKGLSYDKCAELAEELNTRRGLSNDEAFRIVGSSMKASRTAKAPKLVSDVSDVLGCWADDGQHLMLVERAGLQYLVRAEKTDSDDSPPDDAPDTCNAYLVYVKRLDGTGTASETAPCWSDCEHEGHLAWLIEQAEDAGLFEACAYDAEVVKL